MTDPIGALQLTSHHKCVDRHEVSRSLSREKQVALLLQRGRAMLCIRQ